MMGKIIDRNPLFFAFFVPGLVDMVMTLVGQSSTYWKFGSSVNEASPAYYFLLFSPWLFMFGSMVWFGIWYRLLNYFGEAVKLLIVFVFISGHSWGVGSWFVKLFKESGFYQLGNQYSTMLLWMLIMFYFLFTSCIASYCLKVYISSKKNRR